MKRLSNVVLILVIMVITGCDTRYNENDFDTMRQIRGVIVDIKLFQNMFDNNYTIRYKIRYGAEGFCDLILKDKDEIWIKSRPILQKGTTVIVPDSFR